MALGSVIRSRENLMSAAVTVCPNRWCTSAATAAGLTPESRRRATSGVRSPNRKVPSMAASSTNTADRVNAGPPLVPDVKPTTRYWSGPVLVMI